MPVAEWLVHPEGEEEFARAERGPDDLVTLHRPGHGGGQAGRRAGDVLEESGADVEQDPVGDRLGRAAPRLPREGAGVGGRRDLVVVHWIELGVEKPVSARTAAFTDLHRPAIPEVVVPPQAFRRGQVTGVGGVAATVRPAVSPVVGRVSWRHEHQGAMD